MNSQQLLIINFLILGFLVLFFFTGRSKPKQLHLKITPPPQEPAVPSAEAAEDRVASAEKKEPESGVITLGPAHIRQLAGNAVYFVYNGHEWEAHEVLGLPKECDLQGVTAQYQKLIKTSDPSTFEFYDAAFSALLKSRKKV